MWRYRWVCAGCLGGDIIAKFCSEAHLSAHGNVLVARQIMASHVCVDGKLIGPEHMFTKVRHQPFSVYMHFIGPEKKKGQEALYVAGANNGKMVAHAGGRFGIILPTVLLRHKTILGVLLLSVAIITIRCGTDRSEHNDRRSRALVQWSREGAISRLEPEGAVDAVGRIIDFPPRYPQHGTRHLSTGRLGAWIRRL